jgi:hypothetical protein
MTNTETLNRVESTIDALESQLSTLDELAVDAATAQKTVETVAAEIKALHDNANGLELKARSTRLRDLTATLELHRSDAKHLQAAVDNQKRRVIEAGTIARNSTQTIWSTAQVQRKTNAVEMIRATFDLRKCPVTAETLGLCERRYLETRELEWFFATTVFTTDDRIEALRQLPGRFAIVRKMAEETPNLDLAAVFPEPAINELELALA